MGADCIDLYWIPLGAGGRCVRFNGSAYEAVAAWWQRRPAVRLYHSALEVWFAGERYVVEMAPVWNEPSPDRGVVTEGPVGAWYLGGSRAFRYEVRRWRGGRIPDVAEAVGGVHRLSSDSDRAARLLGLVADVPPFRWGRDELGCGDMWNSNSLVSWLLARTGHDMSAIAPPDGGRAPGWSAGLALAAAQDPRRRSAVAAC